MTSQQIQCFIIAAQKKSFTETAKALYVSQPAVSKQISMLEDELGVKLFRRTHSSLALTPAGEKIADFFAVSSRQFESILDYFKTEANKISGTVTLGCPDGWNLKEFIQYVQEQLLHKFPYIQFSPKYYNHHELIEAFNRHHIDFVLDQEELFRKIPDISVYPVRTIPCILYYSAEHPVANREKADLSDFREYPFYLTAPPNMPELAENIIQFCQTYHFTPKIEFVNTLSAAFIKMLSENGVFLADAELMLKDIPLFQSLPLTFTRTLCLGGRNKKTKICSIVETIMLEYFENRYHYIHRNESAE